MTESKTYNSISEYITDQPDQTRKALEELRNCILEAAPNSIEMFNYNIPAFALIEGGKRDQQIMIAGYKKHVGLYPHPSAIEKFEKDLSDFKIGKGSVQFPVDKPLPKELIVRMVRYRMDLLSVE